MYRAVRRFMSFGEYLGLRLFGELRTSVSMASGTGLFDQSARRWDAPILEALGLEPERLGPIVDLDRPFRGLRPEFARRWPALAARALAPGAGRRGLLERGRRLHDAGAGRADGRHVRGDARLPHGRVGDDPRGPLVLSGRRPAPAPRRVARRTAGVSTPGSPRPCASPRPRSGSARSRRWSRTPTGSRSSRSSRASGASAGSPARGRRSWACRSPPRRRPSCGPPSRPWPTGSR